MQFYTCRFNLAFSNRCSNDSGFLWCCWLRSNRDFRRSGSRNPKSAILLDLSFSVRTRLSFPFLWAKEKFCELTINEAALRYVVMQSIIYKWMWREIFCWLWAQQKFEHTQKQKDISICFKFNCAWQRTRHTHGLFFSPLHEECPRSDCARFYITRTIFFSFCKVEEHQYEAGGDDDD